MRNFKWLLLAPAFALCMAPTGGYPSRPTFQAITVNGTASTWPVVISGLNAAGGNALKLTGTFTGSGNTNLFVVQDANNANGANIQIQGNGSNPSKFIRASNGALQFLNSAYSATLFQIADAGNVTVNTPTSGNGLTVNQGAAGYSGVFQATAGNAAFVCLVGNAGACGTNSLDLSAASAGGATIKNNSSGANLNLATTGAGVVQINGNAIPPLISFATCLGSGTGLQASTAKNNVTTCTRNSAGNYNVPFTVSYTTNNPVCTASASSGQFTARASPGLSTVLLVVTNAASTATDDAVQVMCMGT